MSQKRRKPTWSILYALVVLMIVALVLLGKDGLPPWANEAVGIGIVIFVFSMMALWVHLNTSALLNEEMERAKYEKLVITVYPPKQPAKKMRSEKDDDDSVSYNPFQINEMTHHRN